MAANDAKASAATRSKVVKTALHYTGYFLHGLLNSLPGASLSEVAILTSSELTDVTCILSWRYGGMLLGIAIGGLAYDVIQSNLLLSLSCLLMGACLIVAPFLKALLHFSVVMGIAGLGTGLLCVGTLYDIALLWKKRRAAILQGVLLIATVGSFIMPYVVAPFLLPKMRTNDLVGNEKPYASKELYQTNLSEWLHIASDSTDMPSTNDSLLLEKHRLYRPEDVKIIYPFAILGSLFISISVLHSILFFHGGNRTILTKIKTEVSENRNGNSGQKVTLVIKGVCFLLIWIAGVIEESCSSMLPNFTVHHMGWAPHITSYAVSAFWFGLAACRGAGTLIVRCIRPPALGMLNGCILLAVSVIMMSFVTYSPIMLYVLNSIAGLGLGTASPNFMTWTYQLVGVSGVVTAMLNIGLFSGKLCSPAISTPLYKYWTPMAVPWLLTIESVLFIVLVITLAVLTRLLIEKNGNAEERQKVFYVEDNVDTQKPISLTDESRITEEQVLNDS